MTDGPSDRDDEGGLRAGGGLVEVEGHGATVTKRSDTPVDLRQDQQGLPGAAAAGGYPRAVPDDPAVSTAPGPLAAAGWWAATLLTLVVLDDLTFGPFFWAISRVAGAGAAVVAVYAVYVPIQVYLVHRATEPEPGRVAAFFLGRLQLERRSASIAERERVLHGRVVGAGSAVALSLVIGGVLPLLLLWRQGYERSFVRRLSYLTAAVYATEFALLHGLLPSLV